MKHRKGISLLLACIISVMLCQPELIAVVTEATETKEITNIYSYNGHYYGVYLADDYTWQQAKTYCEEAGGYLAVITDAEEQAFIESINAGYCLWLGGYRDEEFNWYWVNGETWEYTNWMEGEPNDSANVVSNENCLTIWPVQWNDINEENIYEQCGFICEWNSENDIIGVEPPEDSNPTTDPVEPEKPVESAKPTETESPIKTEEPINTPVESKEPTDVPEPTDVAAQGTIYAYNGHFYSCYLVSGYTWQQAKTYCEEAGGYLAVITDAREQAFVEKINESTNLWLGGYRDEEFNWYWVNGETWEYTNWMEGEPNDSANVVSNENCLTVWPAQWNDINEENIYEQDGFICEWDSEESMTGIDVPEYREDSPDNGDGEIVVEPKPELTTEPITSEKPITSVEPIPSKIPVNKTEEIIENEDGSVTKIIKETKELADGSSAIKEIVEKTYTNAAGEIIITKQITDEKKSEAGVSLEKYEYDANVLSENAVWSTLKIEEPEEETLKKLKEAGIEESVIYDITPEVDGEKVQPENGKVKISLNCGEQWKNKEVAVYDVETGKYLDAETEGEMVVFEAEHFSMYVVVEDMEVQDTCVKGDVNGDGKVELSDAQIVLKAALKIMNLEDSAVTAADADNNGSVELSDAQIILKVALKIMEL